MRRSSIAVIAVISTVALVQIASAADLPRKAPPAPPPPPVYSWTGCYVGVNAGAAWSHAEFTTTLDPGTHFSVPANLAAVGAAGTGSASDTGFIGGGQAGCNWQTGSFVFGLEGDINGLTPNAEVTGNSLPPINARPGTVTNSVETSWLATVRPRVGFAFDRSLIYVTGGVAFAHFKYTETYSEPTFPAFGTSEVSQTKTGWTIGGGWEYAFTNNWSAKAEYLYARFGSIGNDWLMVTSTGSSNQFHGSASELNLNIFRVGLNYKFR